MRKMGLKLFAYFAMVLMVASILSTGALAASDNAKAGLQVKDRDRDMVNANENALRKQSEGLNNTSVMNRVKEIRNVKAGYLDAKDNFIKLKANDKNLNSTEAIGATKEYLNSTIDYMIDSLDDEQYIAKLEAEKEDVAAAGTRKELAECAKDIRDIWKDARKDRVVSSAVAINNRFSAAIKTSEALALRFENEIARLEQNGEDVTELKEMLEDYNALIAEAKDYQGQARNAYTNGEEYGEIVRNMNEAGQKLREANAILKNMLNALKQHREGLVVLAGNGTLEAEGNGTAVLSGNLTLTFSATDAKLVIKDIAGDAKINTGNASYGYSNADAGNSENNNRAFVYHNLTGEVTISGSRLTVMLQGDDISLNAEGTGTTMLSGDGTYEYSGVSKEWEKHVEENELNADDDSAEDEEDEDESEDDNSEDNSTSSDNNSSVSVNETST